MSASFPSKLGTIEGEPHNAILDSCTVRSTYICKCSRTILIYNLVSVFSLCTEVYLYKGPEMPRARPCLPLMSRACSVRALPEMPRHVTWVSLMSRARPWLALSNLSLTCPHCTRPHHMGDPPVNDSQVTLGKSENPHAPVVCTL
jgi:hypothetical protein